YTFVYLSPPPTSHSAIAFLAASQANQFRDQPQFTYILSREHKLNACLKWHIYSANRLDIVPNIRYLESGRAGNTDFVTTRDHNPINSSIRSNSSDNSSLNIGGTLTYMYRFKKRGRTASLSMSGNKSSNEATGLNLAVTSYYKDAVFTRKDTNNNQSVTDGYGNGFRGRLSFTENISRL